MYERICSLHEQGLVFNTHVIGVNVEVVLADVTLCVLAMFWRASLGTGYNRDIVVVIGVAVVIFKHHVEVVVWIELSNTLDFP